MLLPIMFIAGICLCSAFSSTGSYAQSKSNGDRQNSAGIDIDNVAKESNIIKKAYRSTTYKLPRFVSLAKDKVYVRSGPGQRYPIRWVYMRKGYPVEIIREFENWRKIRDIDGQDGWVYHRMLSGRRSAIIQADKPVPAYQKSNIGDDKKPLINIMLEPFVIVLLEECIKAACYVSVEGYHGWVERKYIWGIYEAEIFD